MLNKPWLKLVFKLALFCLLIWILAANFDWRAALGRLGDVKPGSASLAFGTGLVLLVHNTVRWRVVMAATSSSLAFLNTFRILLIGVFFNQTLPSSAGGDPVRMYLAGKAELDMKDAISGVILERVATLLGLVILVVASQPFLLARIGDNPLKWFFPGLAVALLAGVLVLMFLDRLPGRLGRLWLFRALFRLSENARGLFLAPRYAGQAVALGVTGNILLALMVFFLARSLDLGIGFMDCLVLVPPVILVSTVPIMPGGWGVREFGMIAAFGLIGINAENALALSILFGFMSVLLGLPGGILWLASGYRRKDVAQEMDSSAAEIRFSRS
ncbi:MAG: lysylphosphatidylglycerol synthase transmembrane domain-containing protein [Rhodospirillales bacterium]|nr:lysylphosphatidylglycerol synthase transmembrane domain-containing protein [Rhodospirillales bacterium]